MRTSCFAAAWVAFAAIAPSAAGASSNGAPREATTILASTVSAAARGEPRDAQADPPLRSAPLTPPTTWTVRATEWSATDERGYEEFIARIGESNCRNVHACLTSPTSNPLFASSIPPGMTFYADCADLPYVLRAFYAWRRGLPFSFSSSVAPLGTSTDIRYTARGNRVVTRSHVSSGSDVRKVLKSVTDLVSSAHYRIPPGGGGPVLADHYPVAITRDAIKPGTILYDPNGHVAVVYKVTSEGRIHFIDSHPDNSLTRGIYGKAFVRAAPAMGAGFKRWRPVTLQDATRGADGTWAGGRMVLAPDTEVPDWSDEQFYGTGPDKPTSWSKGRFSVGTDTLDWYEFVRRRLARAGFKYDPLDETRTMVRALCQDLQYRVDAVDAAVAAGMHTRPQPERLPRNIYGTDGDWETYSTPSRDARLKTSFKELRDEVLRFLTLAETEPSRLDYRGRDLAGDLMAAYETETAACAVTYRPTTGAPRTLSFQDVERRLFALSLDPYHCPERRWGATTPEELATCADGKAKQAWYAAEQRLRNQMDRTYDARMDFNLADLLRRAPGSGIDAPADVSVPRLIASHRGAGRAEMLSSLDQR